MSQSKLPVKIVYFPPLRSRIEARLVENLLPLELEYDEVHGFVIHSCWLTSEVKIYEFDCNFYPSHIYSAFLNMTRETCYSIADVFMMS
jgi:hypothetical protein